MEPGPRKADAVFFSERGERGDVRSSRDSKPAAGEEVNCWRYDCVMCSTYCLSLDARGRAGCTRRGGVMLRGVCDGEIEERNSWQSTKALFVGRSVQWAKSSSGQVEGCARAPPER